MGKQPQVKVVKVSAVATRSWLFRPVYAKSMEGIIEQWANKGWTLQSTTPVNNWRGQTTHYLLTFNKGA